MSTSPFLLRTFLKAKNSQDTLRLILVTSLAAGLGWVLADAFGLLSPVVCAVSATLSVQVSVHSSFQEGFYRILATILGMLVAVWTFHYFGISGPSVVWVVGVSLVLGRLLKMGPLNSPQVPATSLFLFVVASSLTDAVLWDRILCTIIGVAIGASFTLFAHASTPFDRASSSLSQLSLKISDQLAVLAKGSAKDYSYKEAASWLKDSRELELTMLQAQKSVDEAVLQAKWSFSKSKEILPLVATARALSHSCDQVNSIARTLFDSVAMKNSLWVPEGLPVALELAGEAFSLQADALKASDKLKGSKSKDARVKDFRVKDAEVLEDGPKDAKALGEALEEIKELRELSLNSLRSMDDTKAWLLSGSILTDVGRMVNELEQTAPALAVYQDPSLTPKGIVSVLEIVSEIPSPRLSSKKTLKK